MSSRQSAILNYSTGILIIQASETIDTTPNVLVILSRYHLSETTGADTINLAGATPTASDSSSSSLSLPTSDPTSVSEESVKLVVSSSFGDPVSSEAMGGVAN